jgi:hypothetical protein
MAERKDIQPLEALVKEDPAFAGKVGLLAKLTEIKTDIGYFEANGVLRRSDKAPAQLIGLTFGNKGHWMIRLPNETVCRCGPGSSKPTELARRPSIGLNNSGRLRSA